MYEIIQQIFGLTAGVLGSIAFIWYIWTILQKKSRPSKITWGIWTIITAIEFLGFDAVADKPEALWFFGAQFFWTFIVFILVIKDSTITVSKHDYYVGVLALVSIFLYLKGDPGWSLVAIGVADFLAIWPTVVHTWKDPSREDTWGWTLTLLGALCNVVAVGTITIETAGYPLYMVLEYSIVVFLSLGLHRKISLGYRP